MQKNYTGISIICSPFLAPPSSTLKQNKVLTIIVVYIEVISIDFYFLIIIARYFNTGKGLRKKMTVINGMLPQEIGRT